MKKMICAVLALSAAAFLSSAVYAQERPMQRPGDRESFGPRGGMMPHHGKGFLFGDPARMQKTLGLSDEQVDRIAEINDQFRREHAAVMDRISPKARELRKLLRAEPVDLDRAKTVLKEIADLQVESRLIRIRHWLAIEKVLNPDQKQKLKESRPMMGPMMRGPDCEDPLD